MDKYINTNKNSQDELDKKLNNIKKNRIQINLPESISQKKPLDILSCNSEINQKAYEQIGDIRFLVWSEKDSSNMTLSIYIRKTVNGTDQDCIKIKRADIISKKKYLEQLLNIAGMIKEILDFIYRVIFESMHLLDKTKEESESRCGSESGAVILYREFIRVANLEILNQNQDNSISSSDVFVKKTNKDGVEYICVKGMKALNMVLRNMDMDVTIKKMDFLVQMKNFRTFNNMQIEILKLSGGRAYTYAETKTEWWYYFKVYQDILKTSDELQGVA